MNEPDSIDIAARVAGKAHERGDLTDEQLLDALARLVNARAAQNGYAEKYGFPFPELVP